MEYIHKKHLIHRDLKPDNFAIGVGSKCNTLYVLDYGLAKKYIDPKTGNHIPFKDNKALIGNARYASINTHLGIETTRRDDLESLGYILIYFLKGNLPWQGLIEDEQKDKYEKIVEFKLITPTDELCLGIPSN